MQAKFNGEGECTVMWLDKESGEEGEYSFKGKKQNPLSLISEVSKTPQDPTATPTVPESTRDQTAHMCRLDEELRSKGLPESAPPVGLCSLV